MSAKIAGKATIWGLNGPIHGIEVFHAEGKLMKNNHLPQNEIITLSPHRADDFKFPTIGFQRAVRVGLVDPDDPSPRRNCKARYVRITEWYQDGDGAMAAPGD